MIQIFTSLFAAFIVGFSVSAGVVLPFLAGRQVRRFASDIRI